MQLAIWFVANSVCLAAYVVCGMGVARRHSLPGLTALIFIVPLWTVAGVFFVLQWRLQVESGAFSLLERQTLPIFLDADYTATMAMYWIFSFVFLAFLFLMPPIDRGGQWRSRRELVALVPSFPLGVTAAMVAAGLAVQELLTRRLVGGLATESLYAAAGNPLVSGVLLKVLVYSVLATSALVALGLSVLLIGRSYGERRGPAIWALFALLLLLQLRSNLVAGDRSATLLLALGLATSVLTFGRRGQWSGGAKALVAVVVGALGYFTVIIGMARANSMGTRQVQSPIDFATQPGEVWSYFASNAFEGEATSAHASLYMLLQRGIEPFQLIPVLDQTYGTYSTQVGLPPAQGFTIHLVAGWWLSVGPLAPIAAAAYLALLVAAFRWIAMRRVTWLSASFVFTAAASAIAGLGPDAMRSGPDALRGTLTTVLVVPAMAGVVPWALALRRSRRAVTSDLGSWPRDRRSGVVRSTRGG